MATYFDVIPVEITRLILVKLYSDVVSPNIRDIFKTILTSHDFWRDLFNSSRFKNYLHKGLFNKDIEYLITGIPQIISMYKKYNPEQIFDMYEFEYDNILSAYDYMLYLWDNLETFDLSVPMEYITETKVLQDNLNIDIFDTDLSASKQGPPFNYGFSSRVESLKSESKLILSASFPDEFNIEIAIPYLSGFTVKLLKLKDGANSFRNILIYILYRRPDVVYYR